METLGDYRLLRQIGRGGMGSVWLAEHATTGMRYALKVVEGDDPDALLRFRREVEAQAAVDAHPNVARVHAAGQAGRRAYAVLELLEGGDLGQRLRAGPLAPREVVGLGRDLARGLAHVHARGILHRDLKPDNVLFDGEGRPRLADFGIAHVAGAASLTETGTVLGTPAYASPEQATGAARVDARTDVYGLGALLFHAVTGEPPFTGATPLAVLLRVQQGPTPRARDRRSDVPLALDALLARAMAHDPAQRFPDAASLAAALDALDLDAVARPRRAAIFALLAVALLATALLAIASARHLVDAPPTSGTAAVGTGAQGLTTRAAGDARGASAGYGPRTPRDRPRDPDDASGPDDASDAGDEGADVEGVDEEDDEEGDEEGDEEDARGDGLPGIGVPWPEDAAIARDGFAWAACSSGEVVLGFQGSRRVERWTLGDEGPRRRDARLDLLPAPAGPVATAGPDGRVLVAVTGGVVELAADGGVAVVISANTTSPRAVAVSQGGQAAAAWARQVHVSGGRVGHWPLSRDDTVGDLAWVDAATLVVVGWRGQNPTAVGWVKRWQLDSGRVPELLWEGTGPLQAVAADPRTGALLLGGTSATALAGRALPGVLFEGHRDHPGRYELLVGERGEGGELFSHPASLRGVALVPGGGLLSIDTHGLLRRWRTEGGALRATAEVRVTPAAQGLAVSPDGAWVVVVGRRGSARAASILRVADLPARR